MEEKISAKEIVIAGILVIVYGLDEVGTNIRKDISCVWVLHPRLKDQNDMKDIAESIVKNCNDFSGRNRDDLGVAKATISLTIDQRNHGSRQMSELANLSWNKGNSSHAQDLYGSYEGTAKDVSDLIPYVQMYLFPNDSQMFITSHHVLGISMGGHAAWHCIMHEPLIKSAVIVVGCPDFMELMRVRAQKSFFSKGEPPEIKETDFFGSKYFPQDLIKSVAKRDPHAYLFSSLTSDITDPSKLTDEVRDKIIKLIYKSLRGKKVLLLYGDEDNLVPYDRSVRFLNLLKRFIEYEKETTNFHIELSVITFLKVGHEFTEKMISKCLNFLKDNVHSEGLAKSFFKESKL